jgi:acetyltransferase-like isoleucine patch superfamily enzyme
VRSPGAPSAPRRLIAGAVRRARSLALDWRGWFNRELIRVSYPDVQLGRGVRIDPSARIAAFDGGRVEIGANTAIGARVSITAQRGIIRIGRDCYIGAGSDIYAMAAVEIGDDAMIAQHIAIRDHDHATADGTRPYRLQGFVTAPVRIGRNAWLGAKVTVLKGGDVGDDVVVGANAVVTGAIPAGMIAVGAPARAIRQVRG